MTCDTAYRMGYLLGLQKRSADDDKPKEKKEPAGGDPFAAAEREQFQRILGISPEQMQAQQGFQLAGLGRAMRTRQLAATLRRMFAPL